MMRSVVLAFAIVLAIAVGCDSEPENDVLRPEVEEVETDPKVVVLKSLIDSVNTGDSTSIKNAIITYWSDTLLGLKQEWLQTDMNYWMSRNAEFGPLDFVKLGPDSFNGEQVAWFKGTVAKDWVGLVVHFTDSTEVDHTNLLRSCSPSDPILTAADEQLSAETLQRYFSSMEDADLFSGSVLVAKGDSILFYESFGSADIKEQTRNDDSNHYVIASTTKMFTAVSIAQLREEGKLRLEDPIAMHLPDFPKHIGEQVTIGHLLTHTSSLELDDLEGFMDAICKAKSVDEFYMVNLEFLPKLPSYDTFAVGSSFNYSNENFDLLGKIIENVSGEDFYEYVNNHVFAPLKMNSTGPIDMNNIEVSIAKNYQLSSDNNGTFSDGKRNQVPHSNLAMSRPAGSFYSTPHDLYLFLRGINQHKVLSKASKELFTSKQAVVLDIPVYSSGYGYGFYVNKRFGKVNIGHAGGIPGGSSRCEYYPEGDYYVIVLSNYNGAANLAANYISTLIED